MSTIKVWLFVPVFLIMAVWTNAIICPVATSASEVTDEQRTEFLERYEAWQDHVNTVREQLQEKSGEAAMRSDRFPAEVYDSEHFREIVDMGPAVLPAIFEQMRNGMPLDQRILHRITKWDYSIQVERKASGESVWTCESLPGFKLVSRTFGGRELWLYWWGEGATTEIPISFENLYSQWRILREEQKEKEAAKKFVQLKALGIAVLPYAFEKIQDGETVLIPLVSYLTDNAILENENRANAQRWWQENKEDWLISFPESQRE